MVTARNTGLHRPKRLQAIGQASAGASAGAGAKANPPRRLLPPHPVALQHPPKAGFGFRAQTPFRGRIPKVPRSRFRAAEDAREPSHSGSALRAAGRPPLLKAGPRYRQSPALLPRSRRYLDGELRQPAGLEAPDQGLHAVDGPGDLGGGRRCQLHLGVVPKRGQARLRVRHGSCR